MGAGNQRKRLKEMKFSVSAERLELDLLGGSGSSEEEVGRR